MINRRIKYFVLLFGLWGCNGEGKNKPVPVIRQDRELDKVKLTDLKGMPMDLKQYHGKTIFINFWATWCKPCIAEMPSIEKAQNILRHEDVVFLLASGENSEEIDAFRNDRDYQVNYVGIENSEELGIQALPTTFIFNPEGKLAFSEAGSRKWDDKSNIEMIREIANKND